VVHYDSLRVGLARGLGFPPEDSVESLLATTGGAAAKVDVAHAGARHEKKTKALAFFRYFHLLKKK